MTSTATNGAEAAVNAVVFATPDPLPELASALKRQPNEGELKADYLCVVGREVGLIAGDASLSAEQKQRFAEEMLTAAEQDSIFGGSRAGGAILKASTLWERRNPKLAAELLGSLSDRSKDLAGRAVRGPARAVALLLESLAEDVTTNLSTAEAELLHSLTPGVADAIADRDRVVDEANETVLTATNAAQRDYPPGQPGIPIVRAQVEALA